jgi:hypothetical protein
MTSRDAILFNNASVTVDLTNYNLGYDQAIRLFDAAPGQLANGHVFGELNVIGGGPGQYFLTYDDDPTGDIFLVRAVPEPTVLALLSVGLSGLVFLRRSRPLAAC